ncbi:hypothetical protein [Paraglaciecola hydrolytica]|uniref:hypothetical protein n=1 Tax=Paraglaciecola hydrolytica TaxID=1799789 RepID=UPI001F3354C5|nr:hypothetical protein [Paraglaciecola hydrolytica]
MLVETYSQRERFWQQAQTEASRACASGYDQASGYLHQLFEAYQFNCDVSDFEQCFKRFVTKNSGRKALLKRLNDLL